MAMSSASQGTERAAPFGARVRAPALALTLAALFWSGNFVVGRAIRGQVDPVTLNFCRWSLALAVLLPFALRELRAAWPEIRRQLPLLAALGATGIATFHTMIFVALQTTTATKAVLILLLAPIAILGGAALTGAERPGASQLVGALISVGGAVVLITHGNPFELLSTEFIVGDLWMLAAALVWTVYSLLLQRVRNAPQSAVLATSAIAGLVLLAPVLLYTGHTPLTALAAPTTMLGLAYMAVFPSALAFCLWSYGVRELGPARSGQFLYLMPVFGATMAAFTLGEIPTVSELVGGALVLAGVIFVERA